MRTENSADTNSYLRRFADELSELRRQLKRWESWTAHRGPAGLQLGSAAVERVYQEFIAQDFPADLAADWCAGLAQERSAAEDLADLPVRQGIARRLKAFVAEEGDGEPARVNILVGPAGAGKTTMLVKLAVRMGIERRLPVMLVSLDSRRIGGADQLKTFAGILGVPFTAIDHFSALGRLLEREAGRHLLFLDTPGFSEEDIREQGWLSRFVGERGDIQSRLVLPAYMRPKELGRMISRYEAFRPSSLVLTRVDEAETLGGALGEAIRFGLPLSFLSTGQAIPEDITAADADWLAGQLMPWTGQPAGKEATCAAA